MAIVVMDIERVSLTDPGNGDTNSILVDMPNGKTLEVFSDGTVQVWTPTDMESQINVYS